MAKWLRSAGVGHRKSDLTCISENVKSAVSGLKQTVVNKFIAMHHVG